MHDFITGSEKRWNSFYIIYYIHRCKIGVEIASTFLKQLQKTGSKTLDLTRNFEAEKLKLYFLVKHTPIICFIKSRMNIKNEYGFKTFCDF